MPCALTGVNQPELFYFRCCRIDLKMKTELRMEQKDKSYTMISILSSIHRVCAK